MNKITRTVFATIFCLFAIMAAHADDVDIYLTPNETRASPPYLMFMVDYRASVQTKRICSSAESRASDCFQKFSQSSFFQLCVGVWTSKDIALENRKALCSRYIRDLVDDGYANYSTP